MMKLVVQDLSKSYGSTKALTDFTFTFTPGIYGILGANGAGKSTLFGLLTDTLRRDAGAVLWNGEDILKMKNRYRREIGYMPQTQSFYPQMTAREFLYYMSELKGIRGSEIKRETLRLMEKLELLQLADCKLGQFSVGMRQRVLLAQAMLGNPKLLILDEPTAGVDPRERIRIRGFISEEAQQKIVLLATHVVTDVECIAHQILLMNKGRLLKTGEPGDLIASIQGKVAERICTSEEVMEYQKQYGMGILLQRKGGQLLRIVGDKQPLGFAPVSDGLSLEEVYLYYCAESPREENLERSLDKKGI